MDGRLMPAQVCGAPPGLVTDASVDMAAISSDAVAGYVRRRTSSPTSATLEEDKETEHEFGRTPTQEAGQKEMKREP